MGFPTHAIALINKLDTTVLQRKLTCEAQMGDLQGTLRFWSLLKLTSLYIAKLFPCHYSLRISARWKRSPNIPWTSDGPSLL